jgi:hypothetical protein
MRDAMRLSIAPETHADGKAVPESRMPAWEALQCPVSASRGAARGWSQQDLFVASWLRVIKKKQRLVRPSRE